MTFAVKIVGYPLMTRGVPSRLRPPANITPSPANPRGSTPVTPLQSLVATGTKLWLDSVDPDEIVRNRALGATGATSNPIIIADLIETGRFDADLQAFVKQGLDDESIAWTVTDKLV